MTHKANGSTALKQRKQDAAGRLIERNERGTTGQIRALDERLGEGVGAVKERTRLGQGPRLKSKKVSRQQRAKQADRSVNAKYGS